MDGTDGFNVIAGVFTIFGGVASLATLHLAHKTVDDWKAQLQKTKRWEVANRVLVSIAQIKYAFDSMRTKRQRIGEQYQAITYARLNGYEIPEGSRPQEHTCIRFIMEMRYGNSVQPALLQFQSLKYEVKEIIGKNPDKAWNRIAKVCQDFQNQINGIPINYVGHITVFHNLSEVSEAIFFKPKDDEPDSFGEEIESALNDVKKLVEDSLSL